MAFLPARNRVHQARSEEEEPTDRPTRTSAGNADFEAGVIFKHDNKTTCKHDNMIYYQMESLLVHLRNLTPHLF